MTHADLIAALGSHAIAEKLGVHINLVRVWKSRGVIPRAQYAEFMDAFPDVSLAMLKAGESRTVAA